MWARSALAPTNTLAGNPAAIRKAFDTGGKCVVDGLRNWVHDLRFRCFLANADRVNRLVRPATACGIGAVPGYFVDVTQLLLPPAG
jgi:polyhydroxyalkanoate synthase